MEIIEYSDQYKQQLVTHFNNFQDYLVRLDPADLLRRQPGYGEDALQENLDDIEKDGGVFYLAVENGEVKGFVIGLVKVQSESTLLGANPVQAGRIEELYVDESARGQGLGTQLMEKVEVFFKDKGCKLVWVEVFSPNIRTHELYKRLGYSDRDVDMVKFLS